MITEPPGPPLPPSGPPSGLNFSRWTDATPLPPRPAATCNATRSTNDGTAITQQQTARDERSAWAAGGRASPATEPARSRRACRDPPTYPDSVGCRRDDVDDATTASGAELDVARDQREQGVVAAPAHAGARVEVRAALAHDDLARVDQLAAVALHAEALGVGVPTVLGRGRTLLVCHE